MRKIPRILTSNSAPVRSHLHRPRMGKARANAKKCTHVHYCVNRTHFAKPSSAVRLQLRDYPAQGLMRKAWSLCRLTGLISATARRGANRSLMGTRAQK